MREFSIRDFFLGIVAMALILLPLFYFYILPNHYQGLRSDIDSNQKGIVEILKHNPRFREKVWWLIRGMDDFEAEMDEREKTILTRDMLSEEIEISPNEGD